MLMLKILSLVFILFVSLFAFEQWGQRRVVRAYQSQGQWFEVGGAERKLFARQTSYTRIIPF